jgi:hypothetical protein
LLDKPVYNTSIGQSRLREYTELKTHARIATEGDTAHIAAMRAMLEATYGALGRADAGKTAEVEQEPPPRCCTTCGVVEGFDGILHCPCDAVSRLLQHFLSGVRDNGSYRKDYQGYVELEGASIFWDNATIQRDVDDCEVVTGAFELTLRIPRFLTGYEIEQVQRRLDDVLFPAFVEVERSSPLVDAETCFHISVDFQGRR